MDLYGSGELAFHLKDTVNNIKKAIDLLGSVEEDIGGSTGELTSFMETLNSVLKEIQKVELQVDSISKD